MNVVFVTPVNISAVREQLVKICELGTRVSCAERAEPIRTRLGGRLVGPGCVMC